MSTLREAAEAALTKWDGYSNVTREMEALRAALREPKERSTGGSTLPGAMTPEFVHAREVAVAIGRIRAGESAESVEADYGFPGGMLGGGAPPPAPSEECGCCGTPGGVADKGTVWDCGCTGRATKGTT